MPRRLIRWRSRLLLRMVGGVKGGGFVVCGGSLLT